MDKLMMGVSNILMIVGEPTKFSPLSVTSKRRNYKSGRSVNFKKPNKKLSKNRLGGFNRRLCNADKT